MYTERNLKTFVANATPVGGAGVEFRTRYLATPLVGAPLTAVEVRGAWDTDVPFIADSSEGRFFHIVEGVLKVLAGGTYHRVLAGSSLYIPAGLSCEVMVESEKFQALIASFGGAKSGTGPVPSLHGMEYPALGARVFPRMTKELTGGLLAVSEASVESGRYVPLMSQKEGYVAIYVMSGDLDLWQSGQPSRLSPGAFAYIPASDRAQISAVSGETRVLMLTSDRPN